MRVLLLPLLLVAVSPVRAYDGGHEHSTPAVAATAPVATHTHTQAQRWASDAALRTGMHGIRAAVVALDHHQHGHLDAVQVTELAGQVETHVAAILASCKLSPEADAALHRILVPLMSNAAALKSDLTKRDAIAPMRRALADYARQFDDPDFATPTLPSMPPP